MPRQARLDAPGTLHHVIVRGIERRKIVDDDQERQDFVSRIGTIALETSTSIYAWALMTNHAHILLRSGRSGLPRFMKKLGIDQGRRSDLVGGGLIRSQGGWSAVNAMRRLGVREKSDERILGSGEFVKQLIEQSDRTRKDQFLVQEGSQRAALVVERVCRKEEVSVEALRAGSRRQKVSKVRSQLAEKLVQECGLSLTEAGRHLGVSLSAVAKILSRRDRQKDS